MRWVIKKEDGTWFASCAETAESVPQESFEVALEYAQQRLLVGEPTA